MAEAKSVRQGEEAEAFRRIADEKRLLAYQLADMWTGLCCCLCAAENLIIPHRFVFTISYALACGWSQELKTVELKSRSEFGPCLLVSS